MSTEQQTRSEVLKDSEATLREVAGILLELWDAADPDNLDPAKGIKGNGNGAPARLGNLIHILMKTYREISAVLEGIRKGRGILQQAAMDRVQKTHAKLQEVTMTTEVAATDMLDGLDKAISLVDQIVDSQEEGEKASETRESAGNELREELHRLIILLQFQDITAQQLAHAAGVLAEVEERLEGLTRLLDLHHLDPADPTLVSLGDRMADAPSFDPAASTEDAEDRQALADKIFTKP